MFKARSNRTRKKASKSSWLSGYVNNHQEVYSNPTFAPAKKKKSMRESSLAATVPAPPMPIPPPPMPAPASGKVKLSLAEYLELVEASEKSEWIRLDPPTPFIISEVRLAATATPGTNAVVFDMTVDIEVLTDFGKWAHIPLLPSRYPLLRSHVDCNAVSAFSEGSDPAYGATGLVGLNGSNYALVACTQGNYIVQLTFSAPYASIHKTGVKLSGLPRAAKSLCSFTVARRDVTIQVEPALEYTETFSNEGHRRVLAQYPPSTELSVSWTITEESEDEPDADLAAAGTPVGSIAPSTAAQVEKPAVVTVEHQHLFSVGEAVLSCRSSLNYTIIHSGVQVFEVALTDGCRVLAVDGGSVMQKWEVVDVAQLGREESSSSSDLDDSASHDGEGGSVRPRRERAASRKGKDAAPEGRVLRVQLTYPQEGSYSITVYSEKDMGREAGNVELPRFSSLRVARQKGFVGLLASTNVELEQVALAGRAVTKVDVKELPDKMSQLADHPILLGYKYLDPEFVLAVSVTKHQDVPVLVAVCDEMNVDITYTAEGKVLTEMKLDLRNNDRQYVRLDAGRDGEVWTTKVRERPVKCARDDSGLLMIPIPKSKESAFAASLIYKTDAEPMGHDGELEVVLPRVDVPVTRVKVTLYVPKLSEYEYDEPEGDLQTVQSFGYGNVQREVLSNEFYQQSYSLNANPMYDMAQVTNALYEEEKPRPRRAQSRNTTAGVIPVDVSAPKVGHAFYFERLLLSQDEPQLHITLGYTEASNSRGWCC